jgi:hypothetical protein
MGLAAHREPAVLLRAAREEEAWSAHPFLLFLEEMMENQSLSGRLLTTYMQCML